jgi:DNA polymerase-3 subunit delta'
MMMKLRGHDDIEQALLRMVQTNRLPQALILAGPGGIGKATLAHRLATYLLSPAGERDPDSLGIKAENLTARQIAAQAHPGLLALERHVDETSGKPAKEIAVDDVRKIAPFLHLTSSEGGWRIAIIDDASALNRSGQNALLKILEEPPARSLLILVADRPGALLPTIHSRSFLLRMPALPPELISALLAERFSQMSLEDRKILVDLAGGSMGRACRLYEEDGLALYREITDFIAPLPKLDWPKLHSFAERLGSPSGDTAYRLFAEFLPLWITHLLRERLGLVSAGAFSEEAQVRHKLAGLSTLDRWVAACDKITERFAVTDAANLDRKLAVLAGFETMAGVVS